jgi:FAD/FMN-containing dehydrogenase
VPDTHEDRVAALLDQFRAIPQNAPVRLAKRTSNLFRGPRASTGAQGLDVSGFDHVLSIDPVRRIAEVEGMVTYERLVAATLPHGLMPLVVPQLKTITIGGAVTGLGIESSSFRSGAPHESVREMEILTGDGRVVVARPDNEHRDLYYAFPNSYGSLGYALRLSIELEPVQPYVALRHLRYGAAGEYLAALADICRSRSYDGTPVDFIDGTVFAPDEMYLTLGTFVPEAPYLSDYTYLDIYYRSIQQRREDYLTVHDYLWRWDTDWFWCSRALGVQRRWLRRLLGRRLLRSDRYWKVVAFERRHRVKGRVDKWRGQPDREIVIQDIEVPVERAAEFLDFFHREIPIRPVWVCPLQQRNPDVVWPLYAFEPRTLYVNFGFWSTVPLAPGQPDGTHNRLIEAKVNELDGRKSLYSTSYYTEEEFWRLYNGSVYDVVKKTYDGEGRLLDLYAKCVQRR